MPAILQNLLEKYKTSMNTVPLVDLYAQYLLIKKDIDEAIATTIKNSGYIGGVVKDFEKAFSAYTGIPHVIACANGTDSIEILLKAFGIKSGDEVIVPACTWISTSEAVSNVGATPVFVDIENDFFTIDTSLIEKAITRKTKAIIPVHLYGHPADMPAIMQIAGRYNLVVIEDCAQAHGAMINGKMVGTFGHAASFSFYPGKNLGAYGDAGCMATGDNEIAELARMIAQHGQKGKHNHLIEGRNSRLDGIQAAILLAKLPYLESWTEKRIAHAAYYHQQLRESNIEIPGTREGYRHAFHLYVVRLNNREACRDRLAASGIETAIHYPAPLPFLPCYAHRGFMPEQFPVSVANQHRILSIPMYPELSKADLNHVSNQLTDKVFA
jgi:dTDP-4-amino-4,6-dideoxygalactose transaminase